MLFEHMEEKEAVVKAARIEINGYRFYTLLAEKTGNKAAKSVFKKLAEDEKRHLKVLEDKFFPEVGFSEEITEEELVIEDYIERSGSADIFTKRIDVEALVRTIDSPKKALIIALDTERHSVEYFDSLSKRSSTGDGRRICKELADEERSHVSQIEGMLAAASS